MASSSSGSFVSMTNDSKDKYSKEEAHERMRAALKGARVAGHKQMSEIVPKRSAKSKKKILKSNEISTNSKMRSRAIRLTCSKRSRENSSIAMLKSNFAKPNAATHK